MPPKGWVKLHRKVKDSAVFQDPLMWKLWSWILLEVNHKGRHVLVSSGRGKATIYIPAGSMMFGRKAASEELGMTENEIRSRMKLLKKWGNIDRNTHPRYSIVTVMKWDDYQTLDEISTSITTNNTTSYTTDIPPTYNPHTTTNKNEENERSKSILTDTSAPEADPPAPKKGKQTEYQRRSRKAFAEADPDFDAFVKVYPKVYRKLDCREMWNKLKAAGELPDVETLTAAAKAQLAARGFDYMPAMVNWLEEHRWEDVDNKLKRRPGMAGLKGAR